MSALHFRLFGRFQVQYGDVSLAAPDSLKARELLCYLLLYRHRSHHREALADLFWCDTSDVKSKKYLRQALWQLQSAFDGHHADMGQELVLTDSTWVQLNPDIDYRLDVSEFESVYASVADIPGDLLTHAQSHSLRQVLSLYRGDLLEGWYQDWCLFERVRLRDMYMNMLEELMRYCEAHGEYTEGCQYGNMILRQDKARERTHRRMMRLFYGAGQRTAALRQYQTCAQALQEELGVEPAQSTQALYEQIRADDVHPGLESRNSHVRHTASVTLDQLRQLEGILGRVQTQVQACIQSLEEDENRED